MPMSFFFFFLNLSPQLTDYVVLTLKSILLTVDQFHVNYDKHKTLFYTTPHYSTLDMECINSLIIAVFISHAVFP